MSQQVKPDAFLEAARYHPMIDVRSEGEFAQGHIPGAHNIPLFTDSERALIGTLYKKEGKDTAVEKGLEIVGPKLLRFVHEAKALAPGGYAGVHCWRGGMRSGSFAWLLETAGLHVQVLEGGYKAYRQEVLNFFQTPLQLIILGGKTGSGKTALLHALRSKGEQVIDLEALSHHKGSAFGALGQLPQPTTEQFENDLHREFCRLDLKRIIWLEDESRNMGRVYIPAALMEQMKRAQVIFLDLPQEYRVQRLMQEYASFPAEQLAEAIHKIEKRLGNELYRQALLALEEGRLEETAAITLSYYDRAYLRLLSNRDSAQVQQITPGSTDADTITDLLIYTANQWTS